jgi:hypothetical protein
MVFADAIACDHPGQDLGQHRILSNRIGSRLDGAVTARMLHGDSLCFSTPAGARYVAEPV